MNTHETGIINVIFAHTNKLASNEYNSIAIFGKFCLKFCQFTSFIFRI